MIDLIAGLLVSVALIFFVYSFLIKGNIFFRIAEHIFIGVSVGITFVEVMVSLNSVAVRPLLKGELLYIVPILLGLLLLANLGRRFPSTRQLAGWSQIPMALIVATGLAVTVRSAVDASFYQQIISTANAFLAKDSMLLFNALVVLIAVFCTITVFTYTREHKGAMEIPTRLGRIFIMAYLGATFGNVIIGRMTLITGIVYYVIDSLQTLFRLAVGS